MGTFDPSNIKKLKAEKNVLELIKALRDKIKRKNVWVSKLRIPYAIRTKFTSLARATLF